MGEAIKAVAVIAVPILRIAFVEILPRVLAAIIIILDKVTFAVEGIIRVMRALGSVAGAIWNGIREAMTPPVNAIEAGLRGIDRATDAIRAVFAWARDHAAGIWKGVEAAIDGPLGAMRSALRGVANAADAIRDVFIWIIENARKVRKAISDAIPNIPDLTPGFKPGWPFGDRPLGVAAPSAAAPAFGVGSINAALLDEIGIARAMGLTAPTPDGGYRTPERNRQIGGSPTSKHIIFPSKAFDAAGAGSTMARFARAMMGRPGIDEVFYDPLGFYQDAGRIVRGAIGGHRDHVHVGIFDWGGVLKKGWNLMGNFTGRNERLVPADRAPRMVNQFYISELSDPRETARRIREVFRYVVRDGIIIDQPMPGF